MLKYIAAALCVVIVVSCNNDKSTTPGENKDTTTTATTGQPADTASKAPRNLCFSNVSGAQQQDSTTVNLSIDNKIVTGLMNIILYEKDARRGTLSGAITDDSVIHAVFSYMQEGIQDTTAVEFKLTPAALLQRPYAINATTGREQLDPIAGYTISLPKVECQ